MFGRRTAVLTSSLALALGAGVTLAQDSAPLGGPVVEESTDAEEQSFGPKKQRGKAQKVRPQQKTRAFQQALRQLTARRAPEELRPTDEQGEQIKKILDGHRAQMRAFLEENKEQLDALRAEAGLPMREAGQRPARAQRSDRAPGARQDGQRQRRGNRQQDQEMNEDGQRPAAIGRPTPPTPEQREARQALAELMRGAPEFEPVAKQVIAVLNDEQAAFVKARAKKLLERGRRGKADRGQRLSQDERERLSGMSPEQRREAMQTRREQNRTDDAPMDVNP